jgi:hypothetical protein
VEVEDSINRDFNGLLVVLVHAGAT